MSQLACSFLIQIQIQIQLQLHLQLLVLVLVLVLVLGLVLVLARPGEAWRGLWYLYGSSGLTGCLWLPVQIQILDTRYKILDTRY